ncbi:hypothetical protein H4W79_003125 [Nocardiopsis terrae]|uniref:Uncharacterized protein n=1 Tax=Nocardiopsis terrae TaxID=372655 RepID=A0ABR9HIR4_9ACTN|nr:hypothetical protein [Nocardiopsis terrae]
MEAAARAADRLREQPGKTSMPIWSLKRALWATAVLVLRLAQHG